MHELKRLEVIVGERHDDTIANLLQQIATFARYAGGQVRSEI
jgi:hypothetical protein